MKVLLVRPKFLNVVSNLEPLGLEYLGAVLNELKIPYKIHDEFQMSFLFLYQKLKRRIKKDKFDIVGFHANPNSVDQILNAARKIKHDFPKVKIMVGGPFVELNYRDFHQPQIDFTYYDCGLTSFKLLCESNFDVNLVKNIPGISYQKDNIWHENEKGKAVDDYIVKPDRTHFYQTLKRNFFFCKKSFALMKASFSCPYNCSLCFCRKLNNGVYKERNIDDVIAEVKEVNHQRIWFVDDSFMLNKERLIYFCNQIINQGIKKQFMAYSRADFIVNNKEVLPILYEAGFRDVQIGLEAVDDDLLSEYNKHTSEEINALAVKYLHENNIVCNGLFVLSQDSTKQDFKKLIKFIRKTRLLWVTYAVFTPFKGIDCYDDYKDRIITNKTKHFNCLHLTIKPKYMSSFMFMFRFWMLYLRTYPKIIFRTLIKTAYNTKRFGWW